MSDHDALLLDLDGTLLNSENRVHPSNLDALQRAQERGVRVMVVTGRSKIAALPILDELALDTLAVVFNGAAVYCPRERRLVEERTFSRRTLKNLHDYGRNSEDLTLVMCADHKYALEPRSALEARSLEGLEGLQLVDRSGLHVDHTIRVTFISDRLETSAMHAAEVESAVPNPVYLTHFPLSILPLHRESRMHAVDVHPPCRGKAEALCVLRETYGIPPERVVAVGDASNDEPMLRAAGLSVAMGNAMSETLESADRVIGHHDTPAIAELVEELFLA
jgi:hydroxymethylpyrimidine pyrophosphatase-like HAD family hydrolase